MMMKFVSASDLASERKGVMWSCVGYGSIRIRVLLVLVSMI